MSGERGKFLTAEWRYLAMINYEIDPAILIPYVPGGTELDSWNCKTFVSIVGFLFLHTKVMGLSIPFHRDFEEVNLRFYVRRKGKEGWRRGVAFVKEIVPKRAVATVARAVYKENYIWAPMRHRIEMESGSLKKNGSVEYAWRCKGRWNNLRVKTIGNPQAAAVGLAEEFITEHYWGYAARRDGGCVEYKVEHSPWLIWQVGESSLNCDLAEVYGSEFVNCLSSVPSFAFLAEGSPVIIRMKT
ncbi:MAG: YqjF family protein [Ignavibacteriales bacterium]